MTSPSRIVLNDWSSDVIVDRDWRLLATRLMLLSLLYDEVLIPDEALIVQDRLDQFFQDPAAFDIFSQFVRTGAVHALGLPHEAIPETLRDLAPRAPFQTRARYIEQFGRKWDSLFVPSKSQRELYSRLDQLNAVNPFVLEVRHQPGLDVMLAFRRLLLKVLVERPAWVGADYPSLTDRVLAEFVGFVEDPENAVSYLRQRLPPVEVRTTEPVVFNRALGFQLSALYEPVVASDLQRFFQSTFAAAFNWQQDAVGNYGPRLAEYSVTEPAPEGTSLERALARIEVEIDASFVVPAVDSRFVEVVAEVRETPAGVALRRAVRELGAPRSLGIAADTWLAVADEVMARTDSTVRLDIRQLVGEVAGELSRGVAAELTVGGGRLGDHPAGRLAVLGLAGAYGVAQHLFYALRQAAAEDLRLRDALDRAVSFRCTEIDVSELIEEDELSAAPEPDARE